MINVEGSLVEEPLPVDSARSICYVLDDFRKNRIM
jgi:hypothetical protein